MVSQKEKLEDIDNYADTLEELKFNSKPHISTLTELARDYGKNRQAGEVIKIIEKRIMSKDTPITHKMPTLYLLDSILKNHPTEYKRPIEAALAKVFVCVFSNGDEKIRAAMFKLRQTWAPWFEYEILNVLDIRVQKIDPNWPIIPRKLPSNPAPPKPQKAPSSNSGNIHVNPKFLGEQISFSEDSQNEDDEIKAMEEKIKQMKRKKALIEKDRKKKELEALLEKERQELERAERELNETEVSKISTSGSKSKDSSSASTSKSSSPKASIAKVCFMVKAC